MRRTDREITDETEIDKVISACEVCRLGFYDGGEVYIVPLNFGFARADGKRTLYFHGANEGRKVDLIKRSPTVGFEADAGFSVIRGETACAHSAAYKSVIGAGIVREITDRDEKIFALTALMNKNAGQREWTFDENALNRTFVFKLEIKTISCKEHKTN